MIEYAKQLRKLLEKQTLSLTDQEALEVSTFIPRWKESIDYTIDDRVSIEEGDTVLLYKCIQAHTSQDDWKPDVTPSLWAKVLTSDDGTPLQWEQPDSTNPYMAGDKVTHNGKTWESLVDNNVWEPGATGTESLWKEVELGD